MAFVVAGFAAASALVVNPATNRLWRPTEHVNFHDVASLNAVTGAGLAIGAFVVGMLIRRFKPRGAEVTSCALPVFFAALIFLCDRLILACLGLPLWVADPECHYRHRANAVRQWTSRTGAKRISINSWGHHDDDFPKKKPAGELRGLILGDSVVMGHGLKYTETFAHQLENLMTGLKTRFSSFQIINTGVQGYSTYQEVEVLKRSFVFDPDFVVVGFFFNDVNEPFVVNRNMGGEGIDFHGIRQAGTFAVAWLLNESGFGRLATKLGEKQVERRIQEGWKTMTRADVMTRSVDDAKVSHGWNLVLSSLEEIHRICTSNRLPLVLLVFPATDQLLEPERQSPQLILRRFAEDDGLGLLDMTPILEDVVLGSRDPHLPGRHATDRSAVRELFIDRGHLSPRGHRVVAQALGEWVEQVVLKNKPWPRDRRLPSSVVIEEEPEGQITALGFDSGDIGQAFDVKTPNY